MKGGLGVCNQRPVFVCMCVSPQYASVPLPVYEQMEQTKTLFIHFMPILVSELSHVCFVPG